MAPNRQGDMREQNETYIWKTLQKALKKIKEQQKIIDSLAIYIINHEKTKVNKALADTQTRSKKAAKKKVKPRETLKKTVYFGNGKMPRQS